MNKVKAIQYTEDNLPEILNMFNIEAENVNINYSNKSMRIGCQAKRIHIGEWLVATDEVRANNFVIVPNQTVMNILTIKEGK